MTRPAHASAASPIALFDLARNGNPSALGKFVTMVENQNIEACRVLSNQGDHHRGAILIGLTGAPGVGKSTVTGALINALRSKGHRVAVVAIDPSSPVTGGALLGDRIRMQQHSLDDGVFIRSLSSRGATGGLSAMTPEVIHVFTSCGFDRVLIETVGAGQADVDIAAYADSTVVLVAPGMGDSIQAAKAGILEIGDIFVVNKCDRPGASDAERDLRLMLMNHVREPLAFHPEVIQISAAKGLHITELLRELERHRSWLETSGELLHKRQKRAAAHLHSRISRELLTLIEQQDGQRSINYLSARVARGELNIYDAIAIFMSQFNLSVP